MKLATHAVSEGLSWQRRKLDWIANCSKIERQEDWYSLTVSDLSKLGAKDFLTNLHNGSLYECLRTVYYEFEWNPYEFKSHPHSIQQYKPHSHWKSKKNQRKLLDRIAEQLGIRCQEDWYTITGKEVMELGASSIMSSYYNNSLMTTLQAVYSEFEWNPLMFENAPKSCVEEKKKIQHRNAFNRASEALGIECQSDWYGVTGKHIKPLEIEDLISEHYNSSLFHALKSVYPEYDWNPLHCESPPLNYWKQLDKREISAALDEALESVGRRWDRLLESRFFHSSCHVFMS
jgi:hypothetical protein